MQALASWLDRQPQLGREMFARGQPELVGPESVTAHEVDVIEFLWTSLALFDNDLPGPDMAPSYRPVWLDLHSIADARDRILRRLADQQNPRPFNQLLPNSPETAAVPESKLRARSCWTSTCVAGLELAKQGDVALEQDTAFSPIHVSLALVTSHA